MTKKALGLLLLCGSVAMAETVTIEKMVVEGAAEESAAKKISKDELKTTRQMDLGEMLYEVLPEITHVRASGVGNDIILRGQKKDNINVTIDGAKVCGACPNRMDPPAMHVSSSQIEKVEVKEGPFDVANFGSLAGAINVVTKDPKKGLGGEISATGGSFGYQKGTVMVEGGNDMVQAMVGYSSESSDQYEDGEGKTLVEQVDAIAANAGDKYKTTEKDRKAFTRTSQWAKVVVTPSDEQKLTLNYFGDSADDVLYPAFQMDAQIDKTTMFGAKYELNDMSSLSEKLKVEYYSSLVEHEMGTEFRNSSNTASMYRTHAVDASISGMRLENTFPLNDHKLIVGLDSSLRNWNGNCESEPTRTLKQVRIPDVDTKNSAVYAKLNSMIGNYTINAGIRYDQTTITANEDRIALAPANPVQSYYSGKEENDYTNMSANVVAKYNYSDTSGVFLGVGQSVRVPDAQELYFISVKDHDSNSSTPPIWMRKGNPDLNPTINQEVDLGYEGVHGDTSLKATVFYSKLTDYIYAYKDGMALTFTNIDATIYGGDLKVETYWDDAISTQLGMAYQKGTKDESSADDKDLPEIPPMKTRLAVKYDNTVHFAMLEAINAAAQEIDEDGNEQDIDGYTTFNIKGGHNFTNGISVSVGIDNLTDETYAVNNSYVGRGLISGTDVMVLNEPGRYVYATASYRF